MESQESTAHIMQKDKRGSAAIINDEMKYSNGKPSENLSALLRTILDPDSQIDDTENIDWIKWIIAGGRTLTDFAATGTESFFFQIFCYRFVDGNFLVRIDSVLIAGIA